MSAVRKLCDDADDNAGAAPAADRLRVAQAAASANRWAAVGFIAERDASRRVSAAWKGLAANYRRSILKAVDAIYDAEDRAKDAEHRADQANRALAISAERVDTLASRIRDLDAANSALLVERQRMQADLLRVDAERLDMHDEATSLLTRARSAERRCVEQDAELIRHMVTIANLQLDIDCARGQAEADRIKASARLADMQAQRDHEATRAANAEAACRDVTGALVKAEAAVEHARQCVRHGLASCSDEEVAEEFVRRFPVLKVCIGDHWDGRVGVADEWNGWNSGIDAIDDRVEHAEHDGPISAILRAKRLAEKG